MIFKAVVGFRKSKKFGQANCGEGLCKFVIMCCVCVYKINEFFFTLLGTKTVKRVPVLIDLQLAVCTCTTEHLQLQ